jgi:hypothetical protein
LFGGNARGNRMQARCRLCGARAAQEDALAVAVGFSWRAVQEAGGVMVVVGVYVDVERAAPRGLRLHDGASRSARATSGARVVDVVRAPHEFSSLPGAEHVLQTHREDDVSLDAAMTGDHHRQGILHAGNHSHPIRKADVDRHRSIEGGGLE